MIVHVAIADAVENDHKSVMIRTFALFSRSVFPTELSWSLVEQFSWNNLFGLEGILVIL